MSSPRQLAYRDRFVWHLEQVVSSQWDGCDGLTDRFVFPDMTTRLPFVLYLSQEEFTKLYSAVLTGSDLTYPDTSHDIEMLFLQMVTCSMNELCVAIANCILNSEDTQEALAQFLAGEGWTGGTGNPEQPIEGGVDEENLLPEGYTCTNDKAFGMAYAIVDSIHNATEEVLQAIEILTNPLEIAAELGDNVPGVGMLASAADITNWIQDTAKEEYDLAWSTTVRDELACLLWCQIKHDCTLTFDMMWDLYLNTSDVTPPVSLELTDWLAWLILLPLTAPLTTVTKISLLGLLAMRYGGKFGQLSLGIRSFSTIAALAADDTSPDWSILCDPCSVCDGWLFQDDRENWFGATWPVSYVPRAVWVDTEGFKAGDQLDGQIGIQWACYGSFNEVTIYLNEALGGDGQWQVFADGVLIDSAVDAGAVQKTLTFPTQAVASYISVFANRHSLLGQPPTTVRMIALEVCGDLQE